MHRRLWAIALLLLVASVHGGIVVSQADASDDVPKEGGDPARSGQPPGPGPDARFGLTELWRFRTNEAAESGQDGGTPAVLDGVVYVGGWSGWLVAIDAASGTEWWRFGTGTAELLGNSRRRVSSPTVVEGTVFVGALDGHVYAVDTATGKERWSLRTDGPIFGSPAVVEGVVYVGSDDGNLYALDAATGAQRWRFATGDWVISSPAVAGGAVFVGSFDGNVYAIEAASGQERWRFVTGGAVGATPAVSDGVVYAGSADQFVYAIGADDGVERWRFDAQGDVDAGAAVAEGVVYVGSNSGVLHALDAATGRRRWEAGLGEYMEHAPAVVDGVVYTGSTGGAGVYALDAQTGQEQWVVAVPGWDLATPVVVGQVLYVTTDAGYLFAYSGVAAPPATPGTEASPVAVDLSVGVATERGNPARTGEMPGPGPTGGALLDERWWFEASEADGIQPAVADGLVYFGGGYFLYAVDGATGLERWRYEAVVVVPPNNFGAPTVADGMVYIGDENGRLYAVDAATGAERWVFRCGMDLVSSPAAVGGTLYIGCGQDGVYALEAKTGAVEWHAPEIPGRSPAVAGDTVYVETVQGIVALDTKTGKVRWRTNALRSSAPLVVAGGLVFAGSREGLFALDAVSGELRWQFDIPEGVYQPPAVAGGVAYLTGGDDHVYALDATTGAELWRFNRGRTLDSSPAIADGVLYVGVDGGMLYALDPVTGTERWRHQIDGCHRAPSTAAVAGGAIYLGCSIWVYALADEPGGTGTAGAEGPEAAGSWIGNTGYGWRFYLLTVDHGVAALQFEYVCKQVEMISVEYMTPVDLNGASFTVVIAGVEGMGNGVEATVTGTVGPGTAAAGTLRIDGSACGPYETTWEARRA